MRDRIADTIRGWAEGHHAYCHWDNMKEASKEPWRKKADILLDLMREPTDAMVSAGADSWENEPADESMETAIANVWEAMIRKAKG